ncbi:hypothetical protein Tco_0214724 [Tanacetum coccineum]
MQCVTMPAAKPKVLAPSMYEIDVEPISSRLSQTSKESVEILREIVEEARIEKPLDNALGNVCFYTKRSQELLKYVIFEQMKAEVEQNDVEKQCADIERKNLLIQKENLIANWLFNEVLYSVMNDGNTEQYGSSSRLSQTSKESVEILREIVEEARIEKPLDNALGNVCFYTKRSQELLKYVIGTCPKEFNKRDKKIATTPLNRKKQVTFKETCGTSNDNTQKHVKPLKEQNTNVLVIPSTGVISSTEASGSKPKRNTKNNRILPAKSDNKKKVEDHPRNNKSNLKQI